MVPVVYPEHAHRIRKVPEPAIFDPVRRRWVRLTPEEWVRQNFLQFLLKVMDYPSALMSVEKTIAVGELSKRYDLVVFDRTTSPWMLVECKAQEVGLNASVLEQALRYHIAMPASYLVITNGLHTHAWAKIDGSLTELDRLPVYQ